MDFKRIACCAALAAGFVTATGVHADQGPITGTFALPGTTEKTTGKLTVRHTGPLSREIALVFTDKVSGRRVTGFEEDLTQKLHLLATDETLSTFVHEHAKALDEDGRFRIAVNFPKPGLYHLYADAHPTGMGQQVIRFDLRVGPQESATGSEAASPQGVDGAYSVRLDTSRLRAGVESMMTMTILKDGKPATDLAPYLGVPAHAVFIARNDLSYVHAHAMPAAEESDGHGGHDGMGHAGHGAQTRKPDTAPAELMLHATPPHPGTYALWIQFIGDRKVRTVPFIVTVPKA